MYSLSIVVSARFPCLHPLRFDARDATFPLINLYKSIRLDVCAKEMGYEGRGRLRVPWWRYESVENQPRVTVEEI